MRNSKGFTLIELLVVVGIIAILSVVVILTLNPSELLKQARDSSRISDLSTLKSAISLYLVDATVPNIASSSFGYGSCYLSTLPANSTSVAKCGVFTNTYAQNVSTTSASYKKNDSTGWLPVNFSQISYGTPLAALPTDPTNNATYYYAYAATSTVGYYFELDAWMESAKYNGSTTSNDGGNNASVYETGNQPGLTL